MTFSLSQKLIAEFVGSLLLLATVVGSGIMGVNLSDGNDGIALLANSLATAGILFVLIETLGPISGAQFNPAVTLVMVLDKRQERSEFLPYFVAQVAGGIFGVLLAHAMFDLELVQQSVRARTGIGQWVAEATATFGLLFVIFGFLKFRPERIAMAVALYILAAYWFTASTSFANPAVTIARSFTTTFAGIAPADVGLFILSQLVGALLAWVFWSKVIKN